MKFSSCRTRPIVVLGFLSFAAWSAQAQRAQGDQPPGDDAVHEIEEIALEELLRPIVVGASKYEQSEVRTPAFISIVTADEIRRRGYRTLDEILRSLAGVYATYDRNYTYLGVRGFGIPGDYNTRVLLLIDGHRLNDSVYDQAPIGRELLLDVALIDRVEFIRGPGSAIYGSNALLGVINIVTRRGASFGGAETAAAIGSLGAAQGRVSAGNRFDNGVDWLLSATYGQAKGEPFLYFSEFDSGAVDGIARNMDAERYTYLYGSIAYGDLTLRSGWGWRRKQIPTAPFGTVFGDDRAFTIDTPLFADLQLRRRLPWEIDLLARGFFDRYLYEGDYSYDYRELPQDPAFLVINRDRTVGSRWGGELNLMRSFSGGHRLLLGTEFNDHFQQDQANFDVDPRTSYLDTHDATRTLGLYGQAEAQLPLRFLLIGGLRYDHYFDSFGGTLNPRAALIYHLHDDTDLKLLYGHAFRAPNAYERFYRFGDPKSPTAWLPNPDLEPETIRTVEAVADHTFAERVHITAGVYQYRLEDLIQLGTDEEGHYQFHNTGFIETIGFELEARGRVGWLQGRTSYAFEHAHEDEVGGLAPPNSPRHLVRLNLTAELMPQHVFFSVVSDYTSDREALREGTANDRFLLHLTLSAEGLPKGLSVYSTVRNVFDVNHSDPASAEHTQDFIRQDGRTFWLEARYRFF